jgi:hypothetical protein
MQNKMLGVRGNIQKVASNFGAFKELLNDVNGVINTEGYQACSSFALAFIKAMS